MHGKFGFEIDLVEAYEKNVDAIRDQRQILCFKAVNFWDCRHETNLTFCYCMRKLNL